LSTKEVASAGDMPINSLAVGRDVDGDGFILGGVMEITREMIEKKAYELYLARGGQHGSDVGDWLEAERQLQGEVRAERAQSSHGTPSRSSARTRSVSANKTVRRR
jgi:Protein of unknown function (DUF2934)